MSETALSEQSVGDLIAVALAGDPDSDEYWQIVYELHRRGDRETFESARDLSLEANETARVLGVTILAQLGFTEGRPFLEESLPLVMNLAGPAESVSMLDASLAALGHLHDTRAVSTVLSHATHPNADVRLKVAHALPNVSGDPPARPALDAIFALMQDEDPRVRDWATFGLGSLLDLDTPEVREALLARVDDAGNDTAGEALVGLARRKDSRALDPIVRWLSSGDAGNLIVEAAAELADPWCLPALETLRDAGWEKDDVRGGVLDEAIEACRNSTALRTP